MKEQNKSMHAEEEKRKIFGLWAAGIFAALGLVFVFFWFYNVIILQQGKTDAADKALLPVTVLMLIAGVAGYLLIRRNRLMAGLWLIFGIVLVPPVAATLMINNIIAVTVTYLIVFALIAIIWVFPNSSRKPAIVAAAVTLLAVIGIQIWDPAFRTSSTALGSFAPYAIALGGLALLAHLIRQALIGNILTKLAVSFIVIAFVTLGISGLVSAQSYRTSLTDDIGNQLSNHASALGIEIATTLGREKDILHTLSLNEYIQNAARNANVFSPQSQSTIDLFDQQWRAADAENNDTDPLVSKVLNNTVSTQLRNFRGQFENHVEIFLTGTQGFNIASTNRTSDYNQADEEWWQIAYRDGVYIGQPEYDESTSTIAINMAMAVRDHGNGPILGVLRTTVNFAVLKDTLASGLFEQTGRVVILLPNGQELRLNAVGGGKYELIEEESPPELIGLLQSNAKYLKISLTGIPTLAGAVKVLPLAGTEKDIQAISNLNWHVVALQDEAEALSPVTNQMRNSLIVGILLLLASVVSAFGLARAIAGPIVRLNEVAQSISAGNIGAQAKVETRDEIGTLAITFNSMTRQLRELIGSLESRVAERTRNLELAAEVGRSVSQVRDLQSMLRDAVELIRSRFNLYYAQVYLTNPTQTELLLHAGTGPVGEELLRRHHSLPLDTGSINGRAAFEKRPVLIADTAASATFRPNPLLPETRSEISVPLMVGEKVVGVLDMQSRQAGALSEEALPAFETLAGQLAIAIQNANLLAETQEAREEVEKQARRLVRTNWANHLDAIHQPERSGFVFEENKVIPLEAADPSEPTPQDTIDVPIAVTGEAIGRLAVELEQAKRTPQAAELIKAVARQVAQQIESLRLLEDAERYRAEAEAASRRLTLEGWKSYTEEKGGKLGYLYDLKEVVPADEGRAVNGDAVTLPIKVRDEAVGKVALMGVDENNQEALELATAVADRLGAHIESLRQQDQTQSALAQSEKLFEASRQLTQATDLQDLVKITVEMLNIPKINRASLGIFNYTDAGELESMTDIANWWNGVGTKVAEIGTVYPAKTLKILSAFLSATPVFFNDSIHDPRMGESELQVIRRLNVRAVAILPLFHGARQIGVLRLQAEEPHNFSQEEIRLFASLGPQLATVLENRRQFERAQKQAERESMLNVISQKIQSATTVEAVLQIAARELGHALGAPLTIAQLGMKERGNGG